MRCGALFFPAQNTKLAFKRRGLRVAGNFTSWLDRGVFEAVLPRLWSFAGSPRATAARTDGPCYLLGVHSMGGSAPPAIGGRGQQYFRRNMLRVTASSAAPRDD